MRVEYSLWLMPCASELAELTALVSRLAPEFGESAFIPHVTIQGDLAMDRDTLAAHTKALAAASPVQYWSVETVEGSALFFQCLYLRFPGTPAFNTLQKSAQTFTGTANGLSPYPHLSLAYGQMQPRHRPLLDALKARFMGQLLCFDRVALCRSSKDIPIHEWKCLFDYPLAPLATSPMPAIRRMTMPTHMIPLLAPDERAYDLACLGRLAVDLYAEQFGAPLEDVSSFAKYLGGSSANIAFGVARLGLRSAMISRVGDEQMGRFLLKTLQREGCDTSQVQLDGERLTALVLLALKDRDTFPLLFYRENCADMALDAAGIDEQFIAQCRALLITGTHLSAPGVRAASTTALRFAKKHQVLRVLDIDYRPVLWGLTKRGEGANRFVADARVTEQLQAVLPEFDLLIGTEEEFLIAGGVPGDLLASLRAVRAVSAAALVVKLGAEGCCFIPDDIPVAIGDALTVQGERIEVMNVLGAGDAFAAGLMTGLLRGQSFSEAARLANACGAIVVSRHACAPAMPTPAELAHWFSGSRNPKVDADLQLAHLHRTTAPRPQWNELNVMAFDHRSQFFDMARLAGASESRIPVLKSLLMRAYEQVEKSRTLQGRGGVLIDGGDYGQDALAKATGRGWWIGRPVELPGSRPLRFDGTLSVGSTLHRWPAEHVVKCLVHYHPDDPTDLLLDQELRMKELWEATRESGNELLLEIICPRAVTPAGTEDAAVLRAVKRIYNLGIRPEWWKLAPMSDAGWAGLAALIAERDPQCRGAVILGLNQPLQELADSFRFATNPVVKGFMVGRSLWAAAAQRWLQNTMDDQSFIDEVAQNFEHLVDAWHQRTQIAAVAQTSAHAD